MYEKFGEFDSVEELNKAADGLLNEGDIKSLRELAEENGIEEADVQDYIDGFMEDLATVSMGAFGRLLVEEKSIQSSNEKKMVGRVLFAMTRTLCMNEEFCVAVMKKEKRLMKVYDAMREEAKKHKTGSMGVSCGTDRDLTAIIKAYYLEGEEKMKTLLENLYK